MQNNAVKMLSLLNPRCETQVPQDVIFDADPVLASLWYLTYMLGISSPTPTIQRNMFRHLHCYE
jgi:hypothetical protein